MTCHAKKPYSTYAAALEALEGLPRPELGSVYPCESCDAWHKSGRRFTLKKARDVAAPGVGRSSLLH